MKPKKGAAPMPPPVAAAPSPWRLPLLGLGALAAAFIAYGPALDGPFLLDDLYLPFGRPDAASYSSIVWLAQRPLLGLTFWANYLAAGTETFSYHAVNVLLHAAVSVLVFLMTRLALRQFAPSENRTTVLAAVAAGVFLLHPVHTEAVAYIASRSDVLSTLFCYGALTLFLARRTAGLGLVTIAAILVLFGCGVLSKEQAAALPAAFFLIDLLAPDGKRNWRLHLPVLGAGLAGVAYVLSKLKRADTAGFGTVGVAPQEYLFSQFRALWHYLRLTVFPVGQNVDPDFPVSRSITEHGAVFGLIALVALIGVAVWKRKEFPLAAAGLLIFVALIAPTSSFIPIKDLVAERRLYFPFIGLLFVAVDLARRWRAPERTLAMAGAVLILILGGLTYSRAALWGNELALWKDSVEKAPRKWRPRFQYAYALYAVNRCPEAVNEFATASTLDKPDPRLLVDWGLALDCAGRPAEAIERLRQAAQLENTAHTQATIGMLHGKQGQAAPALEALAEAERLDPRFAMTYVYRGNVLASQNQWKEALTQYETAVKLEPANTIALQSLAMARQQLGLTR